MRDKWIVRLEVETDHPNHVKDVIHRFLDIAMAKPDVNLKITSEFQREEGDP